MVSFSLGVDIGHSCVPAWPSALPEALQFGDGKDRRALWDLEGISSHLTPGIPPQPSLPSGRTSPLWSQLGFPGDFLWLLRTRKVPRDS